MDAPTGLARDKLAHIRESDTRIAAPTGQRFMPREDLHGLPGASVQALAGLAIIDGVRRSGVDRLLVVGGAGTLEIASGQRVIDQPDFPAAWKAGALRTAAFLDQLRAETVVDWVFVSPAAHLEPGERTGRYRVGGDRLMTDAAGESRISLQDYAAAMLDEAERPAHHRARMSVAY